MMNNDQIVKQSFNKDDVLKKLCDVMGKPLGLEEVKSLDDMTKLEGNYRVFMRNEGGKSNLQFGNFFEPEMDIMIDDSFLNTLGLLYLLSDEKEDKKKGQEPKCSCEVFLQECIDKACYLRHLLLRNASINETVKSKIQAKNVELVVMFPERLKSDFGKALREIARKTDYLYSIGVNILPLCYSEENKGKDWEYFREDEFNRAFSWLLNKSKNWYDDIRKEKNGIPNKDILKADHGRLNEIILENYRLPGKRTLKLNSESKIHLIFGQNGSGKSSIAEALEIAVTGKIERIEKQSIKVDERGYDAIIKNAHLLTDDPASITLNMGDQPPKVFKIAPGGIGIGESDIGPLKSELKATAFRLDQAVMDELTRSGEGERARIFIESFFPGDGGAVRDYNESKRDAQKFFESLPIAIKQRIGEQKENREDRIIAILEPLEKKDGEDYCKLIRSCLPVPIELLEKLVPFISDLKKPLQVIMSKDIFKDDLLRIIDKFLEGINDRIEVILKSLKDAQRITENLGQWYATSERTEDFKLTLDEWLEMSVLKDISEKYYVVVKTLKDCDIENWDLKKEIEVFTPHIEEFDPARLKEMIEMWTLKRDELRRQLESGQEEKTLAKKGKDLKASIPIRLKLSQTEIALLNQVGEWISCTGLGSSIRESLSRNSITKFNDWLTIGLPNWTVDLKSRIKELIEVCEEVSSKRNEFSRTCMDRYNNLTKTLEANRALKNKESKVKDTFLKYLSSEEKDKGQPKQNVNEVKDESKQHINLVEALNELMDLFTPARWAYEPISVKHEYSYEQSDKGQGHKLRFLVGDSARADLRLNTAELNIFAFSLFLLCAMRNENPLSLLILDDPLQNMDELTVTALVRGLGKLVKIFPEDKQILMLFHGKEHLEFFRREVESAVYYLPWLSPSTTESSEPIKIECDVTKSLISPKPQDIRVLLGIN